ncbi:MAG: excinuclease ABC subunit UvrC [Deltaproteobacteria bacterium]
MSIPEAVLAKLETLPTQPGCYLFRDRKAVVVYVGKAKSLRARVRQYFQAGTSDYRYFIPLLERVLGDIDTIVTDSEKEAVLLEDALIKEHKPRYNVKLRDDKNYLSLRLDKKVEWPRLEVKRRPVADGASYFGPYPSASAARRSLHLVNKHFHLRTCDDAMFASRTRPCLEYQIKRCPGPCVIPVDHDEYVQQVRYVELFLEGRNDELCDRIETGMKTAAKSLEFERAGALRDQLTALRSVQERQRVAEVSDVDRDVIGLYREGDAVAVTVVVVRAGFVRDTQTSVLTKMELPDDELISVVLSRRYGLGEDDLLKTARIPDEVVVPVLPEAHEGIAEWLSEKHGRKVALAIPQRGARSRLLAMAQDNAQHGFREKRVREKGATDHAAALQTRLGLAKPPHLIECVDISHHQGGETVGAIVCLKDGVPHKPNYRSFHVQSESTGNDFAAMLEVLRRRFKRGKDQEAGWTLPDLFVVDGGRGQLGVALAALEELGITDLAVCSLAKERENVAGEKLVDRVYQPGRKNPIAIDRHQAALVLLARARDEAHRFANKIRENLHHRRRLRSELDQLPGVGTKTRVALLRAFGSLEGVRNAALDEMARVRGVGAARARVVFEYFHPGIDVLDMIP